MKLALLIVSALVLTGVVAPRTASAFSQEPVSGVGGSSANNVADPDERYEKLADPNPTGARDTTDRNPSPFSFGITGPEPRQAAPVNRPGIENDHLFWNNSSRYWR